MSAAEIDAAIDDLAARHLLRRLPDGQVYRASPAEYRVLLEGLAGLTSHADPMGGKLVCKSRQVSRRRAPEDIGRSLGLEPGDPVLSIRCLWTVGGDPAALSATFLPERLSGVLPESANSPILPAAGPLAGEPAGDDRPEDGLAAGGWPADDRPAGGLPADDWPAEGLPAGGWPAGDRAAGDWIAGSRPGQERPADGLTPARRPDGAQAGHARALQIELAPRRLRSRGACGCPRVNR